jgi:hypothetical protein
MRVLKQIQIADELWPIEKSEPSNSDETTKTAEGADDIESEIAKEVAAMKRPRKGRRFSKYSMSDLKYARSI